MTRQKKHTNYKVLDQASLHSTLRYYYKKNPYKIPAALIDAVQERYPDWTLEWGPYFTAPGTRRRKNNICIPHIDNVENRAVPNRMTVNIISKKSATSDTVYNTITVNGVAIVKKHSQTQVQTLLGGQYLGIYGVPAKQSAPSWLVFDTKLSQRPSEAASNPDIIVKQVYDSPRLTRLVLNNRINVMLEYDRTKDAVFIIGKQITK